MASHPIFFQQSVYATVYRSPITQIIARAASNNETILMKALIIHAVIFYCDWNEVAFRKNFFFLSVERESDSCEDKPYTCREEMNRMVERGLAGYKSKRIRSSRQFRIVNRVISVNGSHKYVHSWKSEAN
jgi:hypothetical protein